MSNFSIVAGSIVSNSSLHEEESSTAMAGDEKRCKFEQGFGRAFFAPLRVRTMSAEKPAECVKTLAEQLRSYPEGHVIKVIDVCREFHCSQDLAHAIIRQAVNQVRRFFEIEEVEPTPYIQIPKLSRQSVVVGKTHFERENEGRPEETKFMQGDRFDVEFPADDPDNRPLKKSIFPVFTPKTCSPQQLA